MAMRGMTVAELDNAIPEHWDTGLRIDAMREAFFAQFEGKEGSGKPVIRNDKLGIEPGDLIRFNLLTPLAGKGARDEQRLKGSEDKFTLGQMTVAVEYFRNAVAYNLIGKKRVNFNLIQTIRSALSSWMARELDDRLLLTVLPVDASAPTKIMYPSAATSFATVDAADTFGTQELGRIRAQLQHQGCKPLKVKKRNGQTIPLYAVVIDDYAAHFLMQDSTLTGALKDALARGEDNPIFTRALMMYMGMIIYEYGSPSSGVVQGSALRPEGMIGTSLGASDTWVYFNSTGLDDGIEYTRFWPSSGYVNFAADGTNATEIVAYTAKSDFGLNVGGNQSTAHLADLTVCTLAAAASGKAIAVGKALAFGSEMAIRGWGMHPGRIYDSEDYGFVKGLGVDAEEGVSIVEDTHGNNPNCLMMYHSTPEPTGT